MVIRGFGTYLKIDTCSAARSQQMNGDMRDRQAPLTAKLATRWLDIAAQFLDDAIAHEDFDTIHFGN